MVGVVICWGVLLLGAPARAATAWTTYGFDSQRSGFNPFEGALTSANASRLHQIWTARTAWTIINTQPLYVPNVRTALGRRALVIVADERGTVYALDARNGMRVWTARVGAVQTNCHELFDGWFGVNGAPVIDGARGRVYVVSGAGYLHALQLADGHSVAGFAPLRLTVDPYHEHFYGALNLSANRLYAVVSGGCDLPPYRGRIIEVDVARQRIRHLFYVTHTPGVSGGGIWGWGGVSIGGAGLVYTATGNAYGPANTPETTDYAEHVVRLSPNLRPLAASTPPALDLPGDVDADFGATPLLFQAPGCPPQAAVLEKFGSMFVYDRSTIASGAIQRVDLGDPRSDQLIGVPTWWPPRRLVLVASSSAGPEGAGLFAFSVGADCRLHERWHQASAPAPTGSTVTVAGGVAYYTTAFGEMRAVDASDGRQLFSSGNLIGIGAFAAPTVADGRVFVSGWDGAVHAFAAR